ncbi:PP2C family protein-serine/threonine phosphatase [Leucobacter massiliensis]|nr:SpoIIE family protein phosphatase [Leucobacter massiliensis]
MPPSPARQEAEALAHDVPAERYDRVVRLAQAIFGAPIAALNLIGNDSQYTVASLGFPKGEIAVDDSVCRVTVQQDEILEVRDLREDDRFASIPAVTGGPRVRFYAGIPVRGQSGQNVGALCILDLVPRTLGRQQREMLSDLGALLERELAVQEEMDLAGQVQRLMLPTAAPDIGGVEIAGRVQPAREAGGDYFDWYVVDDPDGEGRRLQVVLGDVMGKGLAASLIASEVRAVMRGHSRDAEIDEAVRRTSATTRHDLEANNRFSTLWVGRLDPATGALDYLDAGHGLAIIASDRGYRRLDQPYLPLGMPIEDEWTRDDDTVAEDELLVVVSDGVFDVLDDSFEQVEAKLKDILDPGLSCQQIVDRIVDFAVANAATDDVTALAVRRTGAEPAFDAGTAEGTTTSHRVGSGSGTSGTGTAGGSQEIPAPEG